MRRPFFAVLGGMGTLATESFIRLVNRAVPTHTDQDFLDYVVFNDASVPDRTAFILGRSDDDPFPVLADDVPSRRFPRHRGVARFRRVPEGRRGGGIHLRGT